MNLKGVSSITVNTWEKRQQSNEKIVVLFIGIIHFIAEHVRYVV